MFNKQHIIASPTNEQPPDNGIHFTVVNSFENVNFFSCITDEDPNYDFSDMTVWINNKKSSQSVNSITANANVDVLTF